MESNNPPNNNDIKKSIIRKINEFIEKEDKKEDKNEDGNITLTDYEIRYIQILLKSVNDITSFVSQFQNMDEPLKNELVSMNILNETDKEMLTTLKDILANTLDKEISFDKKISNEELGGKRHQKTKKQKNKKTKKRRTTKKRH